MNETSFIVSINAGSSSVKVTAVHFDGGTDAHTVVISPVADAVEAVREAMVRLKNELLGFDDRTIVAIGHRVVHGGEQAQVARLLDAEVLEEIRHFAELDPEHAPATLAIMSATMEDYPEIPHIACFDTAFFHNVPDVARRTTLPRRYEALGVRRYGFHGLSYQYLLETVIKLYPPAAQEKIIFAHLGSGSSLAAVVNGKPVDMTMGFSPTSGIMTSSRSGDVDPSLVGFLAQKTNMSVDEWTSLTNRESGLLGVSELSGDMHTLLQEEATNPKAREAVELYVYQVQKAIGQLAAAMGGVDRLVFADGIGEKSAVLRARITEKLAHLGIVIDEAANQGFNVKQADEGFIGNWSAAAVQVIATDENAIIAEHVRQLLAAQK